jgi:pimeloyl-ACP methyl ester carboxylesterase
VTQQWLTEQQQGQTLHAYQVTTGDGEVLHGKLIRHPDARFTMIYFGGNLFDSGRDSLSVVKALGQFQNNILMLDYRGYNGNGGKPDVTNLASDGVAIYDAVVADASLGQKPVLLHGFSLGSVVAAHVAGQRPAKALVLQGSLTNVSEMANARVPLLMRPFVNFEIAKELQQVDNKAVLARIRMPVLICVGADDSETRPVMSEDLFAVSASPIKQLYIARDAGHGNLFAAAEAVAEYKTFLARAMTGS